MLKILAAMFLSYCAYRLTSDYLQTSRTRVTKAQLKQSLKIVRGGK